MMFAVSKDVPMLSIILLSHAYTSMDCIYEYGNVILEVKQEDKHKTVQSLLYSPPTKKCEFCVCEYICHVNPRQVSKTVENRFFFSLATAQHIRFSTWYYNVCTE
jgi:hypothetical protein